MNASNDPNAIHSNVTRKVHGVD